MQGWLSLSNSGPGEGTLKLLPSLKLSTAYIMLRPFFVNDEHFDASQPTFPGATPGKGQFFPTSTWHPHLQLERTVVSVPRVKPGDYVFWHADLVHEVEGLHGGLEDNSVSSPSHLGKSTTNRTALICRSYITPTFHCAHITSKIC